MAATGKTPIITFHSNTASTQPTIGGGGNLAVGELALNIPDGKLYFTDGTTLFNFSTVPSVATSANNLTGGAALRVPVQTAPNTTGFVAAPSASGQVLTYNGTNIVWAAGGGGGTTTNALTVNDSGAGTASPFTFNGSTAQTISYNSIGASPLAGSSSLTTLGAVTSGTIDNVVIGGTTPAAITGTTITATTGIFGGSF